MSRPGDFNLDGTAGNAADLVYLASNLDTITPKLNIHDLNRDGVVDVSDVDYLANYIVGNTGYNLPSSTILGYNITASGDNIVAIGNNSSVTHENSIVIGQGAATSGPNQVIIGNNNQNVFINGTIQFGSFSINGPLDASSLHIDNNVGVGTNSPSCKVDISSNDAIKIPVGTTSERPTPSLGQIRYNSQLSTYEGYGAGNAWGSLGGVKDVDGDTYILAESSATADNDQLQFFTDNVERMRIDEHGNVGIGAEPSSSNKFIVSGDISGNAGSFTAMNVSGDISGNVGNLTGLNLTNSLKIPVGNTSQRAPDAFGQIRYNSELATYEGYGAGNAWGSLGGVKDVDGDTYILAESSATADNDQLQFFTANVERMKIDAAGNIGIGAEPSSSKKLLVSGDVRIEGDLSLNGVMHIIDTNTSTTEMLSITNDGTGPALTINQKGSQPVMDIQDDGTSVLYVEDGGNVGINTKTPTCRLDVSSNDALKVPVGTSSQRPSASLGQIRYNSELSTYEGYGAGNAWGSLGGVKDVDGDTKIIAESSAGADNDQLQFFAGGNERMRIDASGIVDISSNVALKIPVGTDDERPTGSDVSLGQIRYNTDASTYEGYGAGNAWGSLGGVKDVDGDTKIIAESSAGADNDQLQFFAGGNEIMQIDASGSVDISSNLALKVPVGTTSERPSASLGQIRYNTELNSYEGYGAGDNNWNPLGFDNFKKYFSDSPPAVVFNSKYTSTGSKIFISWNYPQQVEMGAFNLYLPLIQNINAEVDISYNNGTSKQSILSNATGTDYIKYSSQIANSSFITGIVLTNIKTTTDTGCYLSTEVFPGETETRNCYVYYNSALESIISSPNNEVRVWYENYDSNPNITSHTINIFAAAGDPSAPKEITFSGVSSNHSTYGTYGSNLTATITDPSFSDALNLIEPGSEVGISNYEWHWYSPGDTTYRYDGAVADASENITSTSDTRLFTYLRPDSTYYFKARAKNNAPNTNYGPYSNVYSTSTPALPEADHDVSLTSFTFKHGSTNRSTTDVHKVSDANKSNNPAGTYNVLCSTVTSAYSGSKTAPVHCTETRGKAKTSSNGNLLEIKCTLSGPSISETGTLGVKGWGETISDLTTPTNFSITPTSKSDKNASNSNSWMQNYYQNASFTVNLLSDFFSNTNSSTKYSVKLDTTRYHLNDSVDGTSGGNAVTFYYDAVTLNPSWTSFSIAITSYGTIRTISGITTSSGNLTFDATSVISDGIGNLFYNKDQIIIYNCTGEGSETNPKTRSDLAADATTISYPITFTRTGLTHNPGNGVYTSTTFGATAYGVTGTTTGSGNATAIDILYDQLSHSLITDTTKYPSTIQTLSTGWTSGYRIKSETANSDYVVTLTSANASDSPTYVAYQNADLLTTNEELLIYNGYYRTPGSGNYYVNYGTTYNTILTDTYTSLPDYSSIANETGYRYVSYAWRFPNGNYSDVNFQLVKSAALTGDTFNVKVGGTELKIFYRFQNTDNTNWQQGDSTGFDNYSNNTTWMNPLTTDQDGVSTSWGAQNNHFQVTSIIGARSSGNSNSGVNAGNTFAFSGQTSGMAQTSNVYLYLRIGIPMNETYYFEYARAQLVEAS